MIRLGIHCVCGLLRMFPIDIKDGDIIHLTPCVKCGAPGPTVRFDAATGTAQELLTDPAILAMNES